MSTAVRPGRPGAGRLADRALTAVTIAAIAAFALIGIGTPLLGLRVFAGTDELVTRSPYVQAGLSTGPEQNYLVDDTWDTGIPNMLLFAEELRQGHFTQWSPFTVAGAPLGATPNFALLSPLTVPYYLLPGAWAPGYVKLLEIACSVGFSFAFLRRLRLGRPAALVGGLAFATSAFMIAWTNFPQTRVAAFVPAVFWGVERLAQERRGRDAGWLALAVTAMILGGFPAITGYCLFLAGPYLLVRVLAEYAGHWARAARVLAGGAAAVLAGVVLSAYQLLPFAAFMSRAFVHGRGQTPADHLSPTTLVTAIAPYAFGGVNPRSPLWYLPGNLIEGESYVGAAVIVLAIAAVAMPQGARAALPRGVWTFLAAAAAGGVALVYVGRWPLAVLQHLPVLFSQNYIGRVRSVLGFLVAMLAGVGFEVLCRRHAARSLAGPGKSRTALAYGLAVWLVAALAGGVLWRSAHRAAVAADATRHNGIDRVAMLDQHVLVGVAFLAVAAACAAYLRWGPAPGPTATGRGRLVRLAAAGLLPVLIAGQALTLAVPFWPRSKTSTFYPVTDTHRWLQAHLGHERFAGTFNAMTMSADSALRLRAITGHAFVDERLGELVRAVPQASSLYPTYVNFAPTAGAATSPVLDRLGVRYFVTALGAPMFGTRHPAPSDGTTARLQPGVPVTLPVPGTGRLRAVGLTAVRPFAPITSGAWLEVTVRDAAGHRVAHGRRLAAGMGLRVPFWLPVAAEAATGRLIATVTVHATQPLVLAARGGRPAVDTVTAGSDGLRLAYSGSAVIYQRLSALPRLRWASAAVVEPSAARRIALLASGGVPADAVVLASGPPAQGRSASVRYTGDGTDQISASVDARGGGYLVLADALQTGWAVSVDGQAARLLPADHALVAVTVPGGRHTVAFRYAAPVHNAGAVLSAGTALALLGTVGTEAWWRRKRRRPATMAA